MFIALCTLATSFVVAVLLTPVCRRFALKLGLVDAPDDHRKLHREPVALCGGLVILATLLTVMGIATLSSDTIGAILFKRAIPIFGLVFSCVAIVGLGALDDRHGLKGRQKLLGQIVICSALVLCGYEIEFTEILGYQIDFGIMSFVISVGWLLLTVNSINLIDGADGLCCSVGWIACAGFAAMAASQGYWIQAAFAASVGGALLGFLVYNFPPAKVFLGDSGSMLVGLILGALAIRTSLKSPTAVSMFGAIAILALPIFDSSMAIVRRKLTGRSIFSTDRGHLHHSLITKGFSHSKLVGIISLLSGTLALGAFSSVAFNNELLALISVLVVLGCLVTSRLFGHSEFRLLASRLSYFGSSFMPGRTRTSGDQKNQQHYRLQGERSWNQIWDSLVQFANTHGLSRICLDLNVPWLHEGYHANWNRDESPDEMHRFKLVMPIFADSKPLGRIEIVGAMIDENSTHVLAELSQLVESIQGEIYFVIHGEPREQIAIAGSVLPEPILADSTELNSHNYISVS